MATYLVTWKIDIEAGSHKEAAIKALEAQLKPGSTANVFDVRQYNDSRGTIGRPNRIDLEKKASELLSEEVIDLNAEEEIDDATLTKFLEPHAKRENLDLAILKSAYTAVAAIIENLDSSNWLVQSGVHALDNLKEYHLDMAVTVAETMGGKL